MSIKIVSTNGAIFKLLKNIIKEQGQLDPYTALRSDIRRLFKTQPNVWIRMEYRVPEDSAPGTVSAVHRPCFRSTPNVVHIGCQTFSGKDYAALRKWALEKK